MEKYGRELKDYVVADVNNLEALKGTTLRQVAEPVKFPLTEEDEEHIADLVWRFDSERDGVAGLAAPQIGVSKRIMVIKILKYIAEEKKCEEFAQTVWVNPRWYSLTNDMEEGWEQCPSVPGFVGQVKRYKKIIYHGFLDDGSVFRGRASGFSARVIQHEIDHLNGKIFVDYVPREKLLTHDEYMAKFHKENLTMEEELTRPHTVGISGLRS